MKAVEQPQSPKGRSDSEEEEFVMSVRIASVKHEQQPICKDIKVNDINILFELDSGAAVSLLSPQDWEKLGRPNLRTSTSVLKDVNNKDIPLKGELIVNIEGRPFKCFVTDNKLSRSLMGRGWLNVMFPKWHEAFVSAIFDHTHKEWSTVYDKEFPEVFTPDNTVIKGYTASVTLKPGAVPVFSKAYACPFALKQKVENEIQALVERKVLIPVKTSQYASPIVVVPKSNGSIRICGDYKKSVNPYLVKDVYPHPTSEEIFSNLSGCKVFTVLDLSNAYQQLKIDRMSQEILTLNTHLGLFKVCKLQYGICTASMIFQSVMDSILAGLPGVLAYQDDVLIGGKDKKECHERTMEVLKRFQEFNVKVNKSKCQWLMTDCTYLGHRLTSNGIFPCKDKCDSIKNAPIPPNVSCLKSWLGLVEFYHHLVPNLSMVLSPLYNLTKESVQYNWDKKCDVAFKKTKELIVEASGVTYFDPSRPLIITTDASRYGVGSILSLVDKEGVERPVFFHSASLSEAQKNYSQTDLEALAIVVAVKRFHKYVFGRKFCIRTDHKALEYIFHPNRNIPAMTASRLQRWSIILSAYDYDLKHVKGSTIRNVDALSRNPLPETVNVHSFAYVGEVPIAAEQIQLATKQDETLSSVISAIRYGWKNDPKLRPYYLLRSELTVENGVLVRGYRVVIPSVYREKVLQMLHEGHPGINRIKLLARGCVWWPNIDSQLENLVTSCTVCQASRPAQKKKTNAVWNQASVFFERVHIDFFDKDGAKFLILVDAYSGWIEVWLMGKTDAASVINKLRTCFAQFGLARCLVADNGPPFQSSEFRSFLTNNGIKYLNSPPMNPMSNGLAEKGVQICKKMLERCKKEGTMQAKLDSCLLAYRTTPKANGKTPYELVFRHAPNTRLSLLRPTSGQKPSPLKVVEFKDDEKVWVSTAGTVNPDNWVTGTIIERNSPTTYYVRINGKSRLCHVDKIRPFFNTSESSGEPVSQEVFPNLMSRNEPRNETQSVCPKTPSEMPVNDSEVVPLADSVPNRDLLEASDSPQPASPDMVQGSPVKAPVVPVQNSPGNLSFTPLVSVESPGPILRRSSRDRKAPKKLDL